MKEMPKGYILRNCPKCKIKLIVAKVSADAKACVLCNFVFPTEKSEEQTRKKQGCKQKGSRKV